MIGRTLEIIHIEPSAKADLDGMTFASLFSDSFCRRPQAARTQDLLDSAYGILSYCESPNFNLPAVYPVHKIFPMPNKQGNRHALIGQTVTPVPKTFFRVQQSFFAPRNTPPIFQPRVKRSFS